MKIAQVSSEYFPAIGGVGQVVRELAERQVRLGHEVHVFTTDWDKYKRVKIRHEVINGVHVHRCFHIARISAFATIWPEIFTKLLRGKFDIIHSHVFGHVHFILSALVAKARNIPHIHTTHCPWTDAHRSFFGRIGVFASYNLFSRIALKMTQKVIAITPWEINFIKKYGGSDDQIVVIPNGMDEAFFKKIENNSFKKDHGIKDKLVLFFGRLNVTKGPDKFVEIAKSILKKRSDVTFVMCGPDEGMKDTVKKFIGKEKRIILLDPIIGNRPKVIGMYQAADVFVLPSFREGLPLTLFEAMASGPPIVASPVNGIPYEMKDPENGFLVPYGKNNIFVERIIQFLDNPELSRKVSLNNIKKAKNYQWGTICDRTLEIYKKSS